MVGDAELSITVLPVLPEMAVGLERWVWRPEVGGISKREGGTGGELGKRDLEEPEEEEGSQFWGDEVEGEGEGDEDKKGEWAGEEWAEKEEGESRGGEEAERGTPREGKEGEEERSFWATACLFSSMI